ncbi:MAG: DUF6494 family protein, partial [Alphaproteobacteria bacterium]
MCCWKIVPAPEPSLAPRARHRRPGTLRYWAGAVKTRTAALHWRVDRAHSNRRPAMDEDRFNMSVRKFLKVVGV